MRANGSCIPALVALIAVLAHTEAGTVSVENCDDLKAAVAATLTEDTLAQISPADAVIDCDPDDSDFVTLKVRDNVLTVETVDGSEGSVTLSGVRFEVRRSADLIWAPKASFTGTTTQNLEVNGGWLHVAQGSKAKFLNDISVTGYTVTSTVEPGTDFSEDQWDGGCVWNKGYFRVEGSASFLSCDNNGGGESNPGQGGAIFNGDTGSILFADGVDIQDTSITGDEGNDGAGIYNLGKVNIKGASIFDDLVADTDERSGGAIFNAEGAQFYFRSKGTAEFTATRAAKGGALYNAGDFRFSGPATFSLCDESAIYNVGTLKLSEGSVFSDNRADVRGGAITNLIGGTIDIPDDITFINNVVDEDPMCTGIFFQIRQQTSNSDGTTDLEEIFECFP